MAEPKTPAEPKIPAEQKVPDEIIKWIKAMKIDLDSVKTNPAGAVTRGFILEQTKILIAAIEKGKKDEPKLWWEITLEAIGLENTAKAIKEKMGAEQIIATLVIPILIVTAAAVLAMSLVLNGLVLKFTTWRAERAYQKALRDPNRDPNAPLPSREGKMWARDPDSGRPMLATLKERNNMQAVSINPDGLTDENLRTLETALQRIKPTIIDFNDAAKQIPKPSEMTKMAKGIEAIATALEGNGLKNNAFGKFAEAAGHEALESPKISNLAGDVDKLDKKLQNFKSSNLTAVANATGSLVEPTQTLAEKFRELARAAQAVSGAVGTA
jgi:hypothetical protein